MTYSPALQAPFDLADVAVRRLSAFASLSAIQQAALAGYFKQTETVSPRSEIVTEGSVIRRPLMLLQGWACEVRILPDGRRQILGFILPGETIGSPRAHKSIALSTVVTITPVVVSDMGGLKASLTGDGEADSLRDAFVAAETFEAGCRLNHILRLGRLTAYERLAHLLLELRDRLMLAGLATSTCFVMPLTQEVLADALGLSIVHVNRTLQHLRRERLIELKGTYVDLLDPDLLVSIADYHTPIPLTKPMRG